MNSRLDETQSAHISECTLADALRLENSPDIDVQSVDPKKTGADLQSPSLKRTSTDVPLDQILVEDNLQTRAEVNQEVVDDYAEQMGAGVDFPAIDVFLIEDKYVLVDGRHRLEAARELGRASIKITIHCGSEFDAVHFALGANRRHGLRRTHADKRRTVELALKHMPYASTRVLAEICGVSHTLVRKMQDESGVETDSNSRVVGADHKSYAKKKQKSAATNQRRGRQTSISHAEQQMQSENGDVEPPTGDTPDNETNRESLPYPQHDQTAICNAAEDELIERGNGEKVPFHAGMITAAAIRNKQSGLIRYLPKDSEAVRGNKLDRLETYFVRLAERVNELTDGTDDERELVIGALEALKHVLEQGA